MMENFKMDQCTKELEEQMNKPSQSFEEYLRKNNTKMIIDHALRISRNADNKIQFYIHPSGKDGETLDFEVEGNVLKLVNRS